MLASEKKVCWHGMLSYVLERLEVNSFTGSQLPHLIKTFFFLKKIIFLFLEEDN